MKIAVIGHLKHPIREPFAGGLERFTFELVEQLARRGHQVTLLAAGDSSAKLPVFAVTPRSTIAASESMFGCTDHGWVEATEDRLYAETMARLRMADFDLVHNNSIHPTPLELACTLPMPMVTTLHVPPLRRLRSLLARGVGEQAGHMINISRSNARSWQALTPAQSVISNGVDVSFWRPIERGFQRRAIWFGRILPDKGVHSAIDAAHLARVPIDVVGPVDDRDYFQLEVKPRLKSDDRYLGHRSHVELRNLVAGASVAVVTPHWDEPFGLVAAEALACGTPVAAYARGALPEIVREDVGALAEPGDVNGLAGAMQACLGRSVGACRQWAVERFSLTTMVRRYERAYQRMMVRVAA